jgi:hypothetical protein
MFKTSWNDHPGNLVLFLYVWIQVMSISASTCHSNELSTWGHALMAPHGPKSAQFSVGLVASQRLVVEVTPKKAAGAAWSNHYAMKYGDPRVSSRVGGSLTTIHKENEAKACGHVFSVAEKYIDRSNLLTAIQISGRNGVSLQVACW